MTRFFMLLCLWWVSAAVFAADTKPLVMGYYTNWAIYSNNPETVAVPQVAYPVPGSRSMQGGGSAQTNADLTGKLEGMNAIAYAFFEIRTDHPDHNGKIYFSDPWADLAYNTQVRDTFCFVNEDKPKNADLCWPGLNAGTQFVSGSSAYGYGNFTAFSKLQNARKDLKKLIAIGGWGHDEGFDLMFDDQNPDASQSPMNRFVESAKRIVEGYGLDGINLDYEKKALDQKKIRGYGKLIQKLRQAMPNKLITMAVFADSMWLKKMDTDLEGGWKVLLPSVDQIQLMTYDFHGLFDFEVGKKKTTGWLTSVYTPEDSPYVATNSEFSVDAAVQSLLEVGVPASKISVGIPAYGRSYLHVSKEKGGVFQPFAFPSARGDLDPIDCGNSSVSAANPCSASFTYRYIHERMLGLGFYVENGEHSRLPEGAINAVGAYAPVWTVQTGARVNGELPKAPKNLDGQALKYEGMFISYADANWVRSLAQYGKQKGLGGYILWEIRGDLPKDHPDSLLTAIEQGHN